MLKSRDGTVCSLTEAGQVNTSHTDTLVLPAARLQCTLILHTSPCSSVFKCNVIAKGPGTAVFSLQMPNNLLLSLTGAVFHFHPLGQNSGEYLLLMGSNSRAISRPHYILKVLFVQVDS
jgi:hypothetical protein